MIDSLWDSPIPGPKEPTLLGIIDPRSLDRKFELWIETPEAAEIITAVRKLNQTIRDRGFRHYSINALAEVVRWHVHLEKGPDAAGFKVNSVYLSRLARWLMKQWDWEFPEACICEKHRKAPLPYFELRELRS